MGKGLKSSGFGNGLKNGISRLGKKISVSYKHMDNVGYLDLSRFGSSRVGSNKGTSETNSIIVDENHRYIASRITGIDVAIQVWNGGKQDNVVDWDDDILDTYDWGNR